MSQLHKTAASLRFFGDDLDPDEVTMLLGRDPTQSRRKGDVRISRDGSEHRERNSAWIRRVERRSPGDLDSQIQELLFDLTDDMAVWKSLTSRFQADIFCGLFMEESNEGMSLGVETLLALGARGLKLDLDLYAADGT